MIDWVPGHLQKDLVKAIWAGLSEEVRDLRDASDQEWAQEGASHLYTAIELLLQHLLMRSDEGREPREP